MEEIRIKLSALWVARMLTGLQGDVLRFMEPGMLAQLAAGGMEGMSLTNELLLVAGALMLLPIFMVFLTLTLPYRACRWANIILATGMSAHGFGIGPGYGEILAKLATGQDPGFDLTRFRFSRFSDGSALNIGPEL